jgi:hypothetical protein
VGFVNGQGPSVLSPAPTCSTTVSWYFSVGVYVGSNTCHGGSAPNYTLSYTAGSETVGRATPSTPVISDLPGGGTQDGSFTATVSTNGDGSTSVSSDTPGVCSASGLSVSFVGAGTCSLVAQVGTGGNYFGGSGPVQSFPINPRPHGYWLVGSDGGIFTFGSALFYGSTGALRLVRPVVGITPTPSRGGYWLVASDGGIFAFGNAGFYGSIPGLGIAPVGNTTAPKHLNAPIVGMVPAASGGGYFMVASDGGVFAFGHALFEGSCPGIGGCSGTAVGVAPDRTGNGYWLVTATGHIYTFGDAPYFGAPGPQGAPITAIVRTPDGGGYWIIDAVGDVFAYGDAFFYGSAPPGQAGGVNPATTIFTDSNGGGYWIATAAGQVDAFGDAPNDGDMAGTRLNGSIIAATGY